MADKGLRELERKAATGGPLDRALLSKARERAQSLAWGLPVKDQAACANRPRIGLPRCHVSVRSASMALVRCNGAYLALYDTCPDEAVYPGEATRDGR